MANSSSRVCNFILKACIFATLVSIADGSAFRGSGPEKLVGHMNAEDLRATMLDELMAALGHGNRVTEDRLGKIEDILRPMFHSMPKNTYGHLDHAAVRYVLHRLFVLRHGMYINGVKPGEESWNGTSPTEVLEDRVPTYIQSLFEERLDGRGLGMHEVAILAATLEHLIHDEAVDRLRIAYNANGLPQNATITTQQAQELVELYLILFIKGVTNGQASHVNPSRERATILSIYPSWPASQKFVVQVLEDVVEERIGNGRQARGEGLTFDTVAQAVEQIGERYGNWQNSECIDLKDALMKMEHESTGRVLLKDFYGNALDGNWQFTESVNYLQELGALDDSDPTKKSVIIPNYINSHSNCVGSTSIYSVCCVNECEALLASFEKQIAESEGELEKIFDVAANLPSATINAPRTLSDTLRNRLTEVASHHGGRVPLHGRLFAQWMHYAYPRECPYPHVSGTTNPRTPSEWMNERDVQSLTASTDEMMLHMQEIEHGSRSSMEAKEGGSMMWSLDEELVVTSSKRSRNDRPTAGRSLLRNLMLFAVLLCSGEAMRRTLVSARLASKGEALPFSHKSHYC